MQFYYEPGTNKQFRSIKEIDKQFELKDKKIQSITPQARQENDRQKLAHVSEPAKSNLYSGFYLICCLIFFIIMPICRILGATYLRRGVLPTSEEDTTKKKAFMTVITRHLSYGMTVERPSLISVSRKNDDNFYMSCYV